MSGFFNPDSGAGVFFQPLRDLGTFYHAKAQAIGAADSLKTFMETPLAQAERGEKTLSDHELIRLEARDLMVKSPDGKNAGRPAEFLPLNAGERVVPVGQSGSGKKLAAEYADRLSSL